MAAKRLQRVVRGLRPEFLMTHWEAIAASDFLTLEVWSWRGLIITRIRRLRYGESKDATSRWIGHGRQPTPVSFDD